MRAFIRNNECQHLCSFSKCSHCLCWCGGRKSNKNNKMLNRASLFMRWEISQTNECGYCQNFEVYFPYPHNVNEKQGNSRFLGWSHIWLCSLRCAVCVQYNQLRTLNCFSTTKSIEMPHFMQNSPCYILSYLLFLSGDCLPLSSE